MKKVRECIKTNIHYAIIAAICMILSFGLCFAFYYAKTADGFEMLFIGISYIFVVCLVFFSYAWLTWFFSGRKICLFKSKKSGGWSLIKYFVIMFVLVTVLSFVMAASWKFSAYSSTIEEFNTFLHVLSTAFTYTFLFLFFSIPTIALGAIGLAILYRDKKTINK